MSDHWWTEPYRRRPVGVGDGGNATDNTDKLREHLDAAVEIAERSAVKEHWTDMPTLIAHLHIMQQDWPNSANNTDNTVAELEVQLRDMRSDLAIILRQADRKVNKLQKQLADAQEALRQIGELSGYWMEIGRSAIRIARAARAASVAIEEPKINK